MNELTIGAIVTNGIQIGLRNFVPLLINAFLYVLTAWIPYINVGTTIGLVNLVPKMVKDEGLSPTEIFNPEYRKQMGEFFLLSGLMFGMLLASLALLVMPIVRIAFGQSFYLLLDRGLDPMAALRKSNELTYGKKWTIFLGTLALTAALFVGLAILSALGGFIHQIIGTLFAFAGALAFFPIMLGANAYIYKALTKDM